MKPPPIPVAHLGVRCLHCGLEAAVPTDRTARLSRGRLPVRDLLLGVANEEARTWLIAFQGAHSGLGHTTIYVLEVLSPKEQASHALLDAWESAS